MSEEQENRVSHLLKHAIAELEQENRVSDLFKSAIGEFPVELQELAKKWLLKRQKALELVEEIETVLSGSLI